MTAILLINDVFSLHGKSYRLLRYAGGNAIVIHMEAQHPEPEVWGMERFNQKHPKDTVRVLPSTGPAHAAIANSKNQIVRDRRWSRIEGLVENSDIFDKKRRGPLLDEHAANIGVSRKTLLADIRMWWLGGQTLDALLGGYEKCGRISDQTDGSHVVALAGQRGKSVAIFAPSREKARGRRPIYGDYVPFAISILLREKLIALVKKHYLADETESIRSLTDHILEELFCQVDTNGIALRDANDEVILRPKGQRPSIDQVRRIVAKAIPISTARSKRSSQSEFENNHSPNTGSVQDDCLGPGDVYEIDATIVDLWIVATANTKKIIGKATLYLVIDRHSRLIVGFYISLENPSWAEAKMAILSVAGDWEAVCKRLGVKYRPTDWPSLGAMPNRVVGDRGEMICYASDQLASGLTISVTNPPSRGSSRKAIVESGFKTVHVPLKDVAPGYEPPRNARSRSGKHYDKDACLTLDRLAAIFLKIVIKYNKTPLKGYKMTAEDVFNGAAPTPIDNWNRGVQTRMGLGRRFSYDYLKEKLAPTGTAKVHVDGIRFKGCVYECQEAFENDWMTRASLRKSFEVQVTYAEALVDLISVQDPYDKHKVYTAHLTSESKQFAGYSFAEVTAYCRARKAIDSQGDEVSQTSRVTFRKDTQDIAGSAHKSMKAQTKGERHGTRYRGAAEIRMDEARQRRQQTHGPNADGIPYGHVAPPDISSGDSQASASSNVIPIGAPRAPVGDGRLTVTQTPPSTATSGPGNGINNAIPSNFANDLSDLMDKE